MASKRAFEAVLASLFAVFAVWLGSRSYLPGGDGYYLLDQAVGILGSGGPRIKNGDPTPYLVAGLLKLGLGPETAVKLLLASLASWWFWLGRKSGTVLFLGLTPLFLFHLVQFPKITLALLLAIQALLLPLRQGSVLALVAGFFHPLGLAVWVTVRLKAWKGWAPWAASFLLTLGLILYGHFVRAQDFSMVPVGYKLLLDLHLPLVFRICVGFWILRLAFTPSAAWLGLALLAPSTQGELFGTPERWLMLLVLLSPWVLTDRWKLLTAPAVPFLLWSILVPTSLYDYGPLNQVIRLLPGLDLKMLVVDQTGKFYFTAKTGKDAYFFEPEDSWEKGSIWRVVRDITPGELLPYMNGPCGPDSNRWYVLEGKALLMREDCWEMIRSSLRKEDNEGLYDRAWYHLVNPSRKRPAFLDGRNARAQLQ